MRFRTRVELGGKTATGPQIPDDVLAARKEWVRWIEEAKKPETRQARIATAVAASRAGRRTR